MDIDIDFRPDFDPLKYFPTAVRAAMVEKGVLKKHPAGAYLQYMPKDGITGLAAIPYKQAEEMGYFKIDFLHINLLSVFDNKAEIRSLIKIEPDWSMLEDHEVVKELFQIHSHFDIVSRVHPQSIIEVADIMAMIRPAKRPLLDSYIKDRDSVRKHLYTETKKYYFKRSHALAYAHNIVLQLHLIKAGII